jgi:DNA-binding response OmpR family regulator
MIAGWSRRRVSAILRILIIDDDVDFLQLMKRRLTRRGFDVHTTQSPIGFTHLVRATAPDVVLLDVNLPAVSGTRLVQLARAKAGVRTRFYLISQLDQSDLDALAREHECDGAFSKSTPLDRIVATITGEG